MSMPIPSPETLCQYAKDPVLYTLVDKFLREIHIGCKMGWKFIPRSPEIFEYRGWYEDCWPLIEKALEGKVTLFVVGWDTANMVEDINRSCKRDGRPPIARLYDNDIQLYTKGIVGEYENAPMIASPYVWGDWLFVTRAPTLETISLTNSLWIDA